MKKTALTSIMVLMLTVCGIAQNLDNNKITFSYTRMPLTPFAAEMDKYWVDIDLGYIYSADSKTKVESTIKSAATIDGLEKTAGEGIRLMVRLETYYRGDRELRETTKQEKRGDEKVDVKYYSYAFDYKYPLYFEIYLPDEVDPINSGFLAGSDGASRYETRKFKTRSELNNYWAENSSRQQATLRSTLLGTNTRALRALLSSNYEHALVSDFIFFRTVKKFKKHSYEDVTASFASAQKAIEAIKEDEEIFGEEFRTNMTQAIEGWKKTLTESNIDDKKSRVNKKISEMLYRNIYKGLVLMDDFETAENLRVDAESKIKNAIPSSLENMLEDRQARYNANVGD